MTKLAKNILIALVAALALAFGGVFFVGCGADSSSISLTAQQSSVELEVGENATLSFTIENYKSSFSNKVSVSPRSDGQTSIFSASSVTYTSSNTFTVTVTALAGGTGVLNVVTLEGGKEFNVDISVKQYSSSLSFSDNLLYVSNSTEFVPDSGNFTFDANTTVKDVAYYYMVGGEVASTYTLSSIAEENEIVTATFVDESNGGTVSRTLVQFDSATLCDPSLQNLNTDAEKNDVLLWLGGQNNYYFSAESFCVLAVYLPSLSDEYTSAYMQFESLIYDTETVYVLPDLNVEISGQYVSSADGLVLTEQQLEQNPSSVLIVPNKSGMLKYILRIEVESVNENLSVVVNFVLDNESVIVDYLSTSEIATLRTENEVLAELDVDEDGNYKNVQYICISQNSQMQAVTNCSFSIYYEIAQSVADESVNVSKNLEIETKIAPTEITVNGLTEAEELTLYYHYTAPDFGWQDLFIELISGFSTSPDFDGIWFEYKDVDGVSGSGLSYDTDGNLCWGNALVSDLQDSEIIEMVHNNISVGTGRTYLYSDLENAFKVRGKTAEGTAIIIIHAESENLASGDDVVAAVVCNVRQGVTWMTISSEYVDEDTGNFTFYLDADEGTQDFSSVIYANDLFQDVTISLTGGSDVAEISYASDNLYIYEGGVFYLNLSITPTAVGSGTYKVVLDNGTDITIYVTVLKTLQEETTSIDMYSSGNDAVSTYFYGSVKEDDVRDTTISSALYIEILNSSSNGEIVYGKTAYFEVNSNGTLISAVKQSGSCLATPTYSSNLVRVITNDTNGEAVIMLTISGYSVQDFKSSSKTLTAFVYVTAYSLLESFYLKNGDDYALSNTIYYGSVGDKSVTFSAYATNENSSNYLVYSFSSTALATMFEDASETVDESGVNGHFSVTASNFDDVIVQEYVNQKFSTKYIYYYAVNSKSKSWGESQTTLTITKTETNGTATSRIVDLSIYSGLMFYIDNDFSCTDEDGNVYTLTCDNTFWLGNRPGYFNLETCTYTQTSGQNTGEIVICAYIAQRDQVKSYNAHIYIEEYIEVETISLLSSMSEISFTTTKLTYTINVSLYPTTATDMSIQIRYVATNGSEFSDMVKWTSVQTGTGTYAITLSCEDFYKNFQSNYGISIEEEEGYMTGTLYVFPTDWGTDISSIGSNVPIEIDIQFRNGSKSNPYVLSSAAEVLAINSTEITLKSHYQISSTIDLSSLDAQVLSSALPIGVLSNGNGGYTIVGFSGSIVGTSSQAAIVGISLENFYVVVDDVAYMGLFAQINEGAVIENVTFEGNVGSASAALNLSTLTTDASGAALVAEAKTVDCVVAGILTAVNLGTLVNVCVNVNESFVEVESGTLYFGAVAGINYNTILQDFRAYAGEQYVNGYGVSGVATYCGQTSKNLAYYNNYLTVTTSASAVVIVGGIVGANAGTLERILATGSSYKMYGTSGYSAYSLITIEGTIGQVYLGGAVGVASAYNSSESLILQDSAVVTEADEVDVDLTYKVSTTQNLLVGGKLSTLSATLAQNEEGDEETYADYVGGIVGFAREFSSNSIVRILSNTSRVFTHGQQFVGGIVGVDYYSDTSTDAVSSSTVEYGTDNLVQAVDDGENSIMAANLIKLSSKIDEDLTFKSEQEPDGIDFDEMLYVAVGNAYSSEDSSARRDFASDSTISFETESYLIRSAITSSGKVSFTNLQMGQDSSYYGDALVLSLSSGTYTIENAYFYQYKEVDVGISSSDFYMTSDTSSTALLFMFYFDVTGALYGDIDEDTQKELSALNTINTSSSSLYPFTLSNGEVSFVSSSSSVLSIDTYGTITVKGTGLAQITLQSILNQNVYTTFYIYVVNYFDKDASASIYYYSNYTTSGTVSSGDTLTISGDSYEYVYMIPSYYYSDSNSDFSISSDGILMFNNVAYYLATNDLLSTDYSLTSATTAISTVQAVKQSLIFHRVDGANTTDTDVYSLVPVLVYETSAGVKYYYTLTGAQVSLNVKYRESASKISITQKYHSMQTNGSFKETISITSSNDTEMLFYRIYDENDNLVQDYLPSSSSAYTSDETLLEYLNSYSTTNDLFVLNFKRTATNTFSLVCSINTESKAYQNRYNSAIYGKYTFVFYSSELASGVTASFVLQLDESTLSYISLSNYSSILDTTKTDEVIVPNQTGLLEIEISPTDSIFDTFYISNNSQNTNSALFEFVYMEESATNGVSYTATDVGSYDADGNFYFTYQAMIEKLTSLGVTFNGKIYISYLYPSVNVQDGDEVSFSITITHGTGGQEEYTASISLQVKLTNYAKLVFNDKEAIGDYYYLARGLSYDLTLETYGVSGDVTITSSSSYVTIEKNSDTSYTLKVTSGTINYTSGSTGYYVSITTTSTKDVNGVITTTEDVLEVYLMEYVLQYSYFEGVNEDIVSGMQDGEINIAIGNPLTLELSITDFLEYDSSISSVVTRVSRFVSEMTSSVEWSVTLSGVTTTLASGKVIKSDYYQIASYIVTPIKIYEPEEDVYYFSVNGYYKMSEGGYSYSTTTYDSDLLSTNFVLSVHNQSTQETPIPVSTYEELVEMEDDEWYILTADIYLPSDEYVELNGGETFTPLDNAIAGLDGNGYTIYFGTSAGGTYTFSDTSSVGLFSAVNSDTILQNVTVSLYTDVNFVMSTSSFNVGLLAASNSGIVTNCVATVRQSDDALTVSCTTSTSTCYVAGFVGTNSGKITNSRSSVNIYSADNLAGFVGTNSGQIASSYFKGGTLVNTTNTTSEYTAGFAVVNTGTIYTSYVSGQTSADQNSMYYTSSNFAETGDCLSSSNDIAGFVYTNSGNVYDSYSNINLSSAGRYASGFVFDNTGLIERCFSTSVLKNEESISYGFAYSNDPNDDEDGIYECYYLSDATLDSSGNSITNTSSDDLGVNIKISEIEQNDSTQITPLSAEGFADMSNFENWVVDEGRSINSVWFFNTNADSMENFGGTLFNIGRLELVSANIIASSVRELDHTETITDSDTGATYVQYIYVYSSSGSALGSVYNPILISSAEEFETYILQENNAANYNYSYYRLIDDVDYSSYLYNSSTYSTKFMGYLEGNFMTINGGNLLSSSANDYGGLFAEVGSSSISSAVGTLMNFTFSPSQVDFANTNVVGAITGKLDGGTLANITISGSGTIVGNNIAGGVVGVAVGDYKIQNAYCTFSVKARNQSVSGNNFSSDNILGVYSFAGTIAGVLSGSGSIYNCITDTNVSSIADKAGLMFGFVDSGVTVTKVVLENQADNSVIGYSYAGLIAGESAGNFEDVTIVGTSGVFQGFGQDVYVPTAVGGFAGLVSGGSITNLSSSQGISVSTISSTSRVTYLGGLFGEISSSVELQNVALANGDLNVSLVGYSYVGGIAGYVDSKVLVQISGVNVKATLSALGTMQTQIGVGGILGGTDVGTIVYVSEGSSGGNNSISVSATITSTVYGESSSISMIMGVGAILGYDGSSQVHNITNTDSALVATVSFAVQNTTATVTKAATLSASASTGLSTTISNTASVTDLLEINQNSESTSTCSCSLSYSITCEQSAAFPLQISLYGTFA